MDLVDYSRSQLTNRHRRGMSHTVPLEGPKRVSALCKAARGNADLLHEALVNSEGPRDLKGDLVQEFLRKCRQSQDVVQSHVPMVKAEVDQARILSMGQEHSSMTRYLKELYKVNDGLSIVLQLYDALERAGYNSEVQERVKNEFTIRLLSTTSGSFDEKGRPQSSKPLSNQERIDRLFQAARTGHGTAELLRDALAHAQPAELNGPLIQEFLKNCRSTQEDIFEHIQWADVEAARSHRNARSSTSTREERLLKELLATDEALTEAIKMFDDMKRDHHQRGSSIESQAGIESIGIEDEIQRLFTTSSTARGNAELLSDALAHARAEDLEGELIQNVIVAKIPWATTEVENTPSSSHNADPAVKERLLQELLGANEELNQAMKLHEDMKREHNGLKEATTAFGGMAVANSLAESTPAFPSSQIDKSFNGLPPLTSDDKAKFMKIFFANEPRNGILSGAQARDLLLKSKLSPETLKKIWDLADITCRGSLNAADFVVAMYLVQACMDGKLASVPDYLPTILYEQAGDKPAPSIFRSLSDPAIPSSYRLDVPTMLRGNSSEPSRKQSMDISSAERSHADRVFNTLDPQGTGRVEGNVVASFMLKLGLPMADLTHIWQGSVDSKKSGKELPSSLVSDASLDAQTAGPAPQQHEVSLLDFDNLPEETLPPALPPKPIEESSSGPPSPSLAINTDNNLPPATDPAFDCSPFVSPPASPSARQLHAPPAVLLSQTTMGGVPWDINPVAKARFDTFFDTLDPWRRGYIEASVAVPFFSQSQLPDGVMATIWELADTNRDGRLTRDEFAVAMHLVRETLKGKKLPISLPRSLIPPSKRPPAPAPAPIAVPTPVPALVPASSLNQGSPSAVEPTPSSTSPLTLLEAAPRAETPPPPYQAIEGDAIAEDVS
ncbi:uncharacterized protein FIBRA_05989 [Fibroporia radiculosa]|uniref:Actin cytoskeleton-regulatory complex protein pan1 n=1 Tax=Fibroporia radiculosa TaxID=599839 RepID=J4GRZ6_9APHY|nr:uncharacterized protein FIBRA_05989 [Fibroporia radiculosa]CCM03840.1 predicted protein [Fibroporia radiculosa]